MKKGKSFTIAQNGNEEDWKMSKTATKSKPTLWKRIVARIQKHKHHMELRLDNGQGKKSPSGSKGL